MDETLARPKGPNAIIVLSLSYVPHSKGINRMRMPLMY
jgi:hypothetical protein